MEEKMNAILAVGLFGNFKVFFDDLNECLFSFSNDILVYVFELMRHAGD